MHCIYKLAQMQCAPNGTAALLSGILLCGLLRVLRVSMLAAAKVLLKGNSRMQCAGVQERQDNSLQHSGIVLVTFWVM